MTGIIIYSILLIYIGYRIVKSFIDQLYSDVILGAGVIVLLTQIFIVANYDGQFLRIMMDRDLNIALQSIGSFLLLLCLALLSATFLSKRKISNLVSFWGSTQVFLAQGIYRIVRYPIHLGGIFASLGIAMLMANIAVIGLGVLASTAFFVASKEEDRHSREIIGQEYDTYREEVPALNLILGIKNQIRSRTQKSSSG